MAIEDIADEVMGIVIPVTTAVTASASVYWVFQLAEFPEAKMFAAVVFVSAMYRSWGDEP